MKLMGFYRVLSTFPTPLQLIFGDELGTPHLQAIDSNRIIVDFAEIDNPDATRMIISGKHHLEASVGELGSYAVALSKDHVLVGQTGSLQASLSHYIENNRKDIRPFDLLEFSIFVNDDNLILQAAQACKSHLESVAPSLVSRWLEGSPLKPDTRARLLTAPETKSRNRPDRISANLRIGFAAPYLLMRALTAFAGRKGITRASVVRKLFEDDNIAATIDGLIPYIDRTISAINKRISDIPRTSGAYYLDSRGAVWVHIKDSEGYRVTRRSFSHVMYESSYYAEYRRLPSVSIGQETLNYIMIASFYMKTFPDFENFLYELNA